MESSARLTVQNEVLEAFAALLKFDASQYQDQENLSLAETGIDSLGLVEAVFAIEERFDISIPFNANDPNQATTSPMSVGLLVNQVVDLVMEKRGAMPQLASA